MSFYISVGYSTAPPNQVNRPYTLLAENLEIHPISTIHQLTPVFVIDCNTLLLNANYVVADFLSRKYFCTVSIDTANRMILTCKVDVLANDLSNCPITVTRNEGIGKPSYIPDNKLPILPNKESITSTTASNDYFNTGALQTHCYLVTVVNGGSIT